jgi:hypothetical protein
MHVEKEEGCRNMKKNRTSQKNIDRVDPLLEALKIQTLEVTPANKEKPVSELEELEETEKQLLVEKRQLIDSLDQWQSKFKSITDKKSRLLVEMEKNLSSKQQNSENESCYKLFSIVTWGPSWMDGLVFTVIAENDAWAEELVREWLNSNRRENHKIDKVMALVSRDVRAIVNVGAKLLDV